MKPSWVLGRESEFPIFHNRPELDEEGTLTFRQLQLVKHGAAPSFQAQQERRRLVPDDQMVNKAVSLSKLNLEIDSFSVPMP